MSFLLQFCYMYQVNLDVNFALQNIVNPLYFKKKNVSASNALRTERSCAGGPYDLRET